MRSLGFTLIELLIVISIIALLSLLGFANFKDFAAEQVGVKAKGQIQTVLRLAQSNATSSTLCNNGQGGVYWSVKFAANNTMELRCGSTLPAANLYRTYTLETGGVIQQVKCGDSAVNLPVTLNYSPGKGVLTFDTSGNCSGEDMWTFEIANERKPDVSSIPLKVSKGGTINAE